MFDDELNGDKVHRLENVMTLSVALHPNFDQLDSYFEAVVRVILSLLLHSVYFNFFTGWFAKHI